MTTDAVPTGELVMTHVEAGRFWARVEKGDDCWLWLAGKDSEGYGRAWIGGALRIAHRISYADANGPIPTGLVIDHLCRNRGCVNPDHLEPVTNVENILRGVSMNAINARKTHCKHGHEFTPENTYTPPSVEARGTRHCRTCMTEHNRARRSA